MELVLSQILKRTDDLAIGNMSGNLVDHPAPIFPKCFSDQQGKDGGTFTIEQECKIVNTRPNTQLEHHHRNCCRIVAPIQMQAKTYRQW